MNPPSLLKSILDRTQTDLAERRASGIMTADRPPREPHRLARTLKSEKLSLIAEVKPRSPSMGTSRWSHDLERVIAIYQRRADAISVLVDKPFFGGGLDLLRKVRHAVEQPILAKGFFVDPFQVEEVHALGADAILLIARILEDRQLRRLLGQAEGLGLDALVEVHSDAELDRAVQAGATVIGVNARDLDTLSIDLDAARSRLDRIPQGILRVAESGLETPADVAALDGLAHACLIGSTFMNATDISASMEALGW